jgi:transposase
MSTFDQDLITSLQNSITSLQDLVTSLQNLVTSLQEQNQNLLKENKALKQINAQLTQEVITLKEKLGLNSTNSSLPPSRDLYKIKRENKPKSHRKPGGQAGHRGQKYQLLPPDEVIDCLAKHCHCGHELAKIDKFISDQKIEIPPIKPYVKEYRRWYGYCSACKKKRLAPLPQGVQGDLLGPHAKAIITALNGFYHTSKRDLQAIVKDIFNLDISLGLISNTAKRVNKQLEANYEALREKIRSSPYLHIDETGHKSKGKRGWAWIFTNKETSLLKLSFSRGKQVLEKVLGKYEGQVISDRYGAYNYFQPEQRQICWSHIQRDFERFAHSSNSILSEEGKRLVELGKEVFALKKGLNIGQIGEDYFLRRTRKAKKRLAYVLKSILRIRGIPQGQRVGRRIVKDFEMLWLFVQVY